MTKNTQLAIKEKNISDVVLNRINTMQAEGSFASTS